MSEQDLVRAVLNYLRARGVFAWRQNQGMLRTNYKGKESFTRFASVKGISDIIGILPPNGTILAIECKTVRGKCTKHQIAFLDMVRASGGAAFVARSVDDVIEHLEGL